MQKKQLSAKYEDNRNAYTSAKHEFINSILKKAREEFSKDYAI